MFRLSRTNRRLADSLHDVDSLPHNAAFRAELGPNHLVSAMAIRARIPSWDRVIAGLRRGVAAGNAAAMTELAITINDGIRDANGRVLVRRNAPYAVRLLRRAVDRGDANAAGALGYAYDVGLGVPRNKVIALRWYRCAVRHGDYGAAGNIAIVYRDRGDLRRAHRWALRAMEMGDGDDAVTAGYNYLHGIGVRRDVAMGRRLLLRALRGDTSGYRREEALYNLAVTHADSGNRRRAIQLLMRANKDGDYPEAAALLTQLKAMTGLTPCKCRRHLLKNLNGHAPCPQHAIRGRPVVRRSRH
jgi:TPR repeat protein